MSSSLEIFPTELIEMIFQYLSGLDIYLSFGLLNHRFEMLLANYHYLSLDFRSVSKLKFDTIIKYIRPTNIYALTLSNSRETIGQIKLFLSYWDLRNFINLQSLYLHQIDQDILSFVSTDILKLSNLVILRIDGCAEMDGTFLLENLSQLRHLQQLYVPNLHHSSWNNCHFPINQLTHIHRDYYLHSLSNLFRSHSSLRSVNLIIDPPQMVNNYVASFRSFVATMYQPLTQFSITWEVFYPVERFQWNEIKQLLKGFSAHLKHLTLNIPTTIEVLNGHKWQRFLTNFLRLKTFNVKFHLSYNGNYNWKQIVDQFRSPFWSEEKKWYFIGMGSEFCSLSLYDGTIQTMNLCVPYHTVPNDDWFYSYPIIKFNSKYLTEAFVCNRQRSKHLFNGQELQLIGHFRGSYSSSFMQLLEDTVDLSCIRKLQYVGYELTSTFFFRLMEQFSNLIEVEICFTRCIEKIFGGISRFERIQHINYSSELPTKLTKDFIRVFPNVKHLVVNVQQRHQIFRLINELIHLESAEFICNPTAISIKRTELLLRTRLGNCSFTSQMSIPNRLNLWINSQLIKKSMINCSDQKKLLFVLFICIFLLFALIVWFSYFL